MALPLTVSCAALHPDAWPQHFPDPGRDIVRLPLKRSSRSDVAAKWPTWIRRSPGLACCMPRVAKAAYKAETWGQTVASCLQARDLGPDNS